MPATLRKPTPDQKLDLEHQDFIKCIYCDQRLVLTWDERERNSVLEWMRLAGVAVRKTHPRHSDEQTAHRTQEGQNPKAKTIPVGRGNGETPELALTMLM